MTATRRLAILLLTASSCQRDALRIAPPDDDTAAPDDTAVVLPARPLYFGHPPNLSVKDSLSEHKAFAAYLGQAIGHEVALVVPEHYDDVAARLVAGKLDFALLTPFLYVRAKKRLPKLQLLASLLGEGATQYRGYVVTAATSPMQRVADLKGKRFAFVDQASASGYLFPLALLNEAGLDPKRDFKEVLFAGSHKTVVDWVLSGRVDAGAISSTSFMHFRGDAISSRLFVLAKTDWIPFDAFVAHPSVAAGVANRVRRALLSLDSRTAEGREILTGITTNNGFVDGNDQTYEPVRQVAEKLGVE
ncbi:MAG: phosphate/phosphite/phosphonate ABC transporter substrate-binding protein [Deltaproteobacteria bacterium]|nr:phosphate/phosphite/phosphonate ABC transporter substrate-binding protein [Deltaproteobacteria bacterium]